MTYLIVLMIFERAVSWDCRESHSPLLRNIFDVAHFSFKPSEIGSKHEMPPELAKSNDMLHTTDDFTYLIKARWERAHHWPVRQGKWFWLDLILRLVTINLARNLLVYDKFEDFGRCLYAPESPTTVSAISYSVRTALYQVESLFGKDQGGPPECSVDIKSLRLLSMRAQSIAAEVKLEADEQQARKQTALTEIRIAESRGAIARKYTQCQRPAALLLLTLRSIIQ